MTLSPEAQADSKAQSVVEQMVREMNGGLESVFAKALFGEIDSADLNHFGADALLPLAKSSFDVLKNRQPQQPKIVVAERERGVIVVDIVNDDMPFLLDSVLGELRDLGFQTELVAHPLFEVRRNEHGGLTGLASAATTPNGGVRESFIHLHVRRGVEGGAVEQIEPALHRVLTDVKTVVDDFSAMSERLNAAIATFEQDPPPATIETNAESLQFLRWLASGNFTFLGVREYRYEGDTQSGELNPVLDASLGLLRSMDFSVLRRGGVERRLTPESRAFFLASPPVIVAKSNSKSTVHRRVHMDTVGIKIYHHGQIRGEVRVAGLLTASAYNLSTRNIPLLRLKVDQVLRNSGYPADSYSGRALTNVIETFPRDELFQIAPSQLGRIATEILKIELTPRPRVFVRADEFGRFASVFVYVPRERYSTEVRVKLSNMLEREFAGRFEAFTPFFPESAMVRTHFVIWRKDVELLQPTEADLERKVNAIVRTWRDEFAEGMTDHFGDTGMPLIEKYGNAFSVGYMETNRPSRALLDVQRLEKLGPNMPIDIDLYRNDMTAPDTLRATLQQLDAPVALSKRVPVLENLGFQVVSERTFRLTPQVAGGERVVYLHDSELKLTDGKAGEFNTRRSNIEDAFLAVWGNRAANDRFNALILSAGLTWQQTALLRAYSSYLRQSGALFGQIYIADTLSKHATVSAELFSLFDAMFNPRAAYDTAGREAEQERIVERIKAMLEKISVLDEDRILRSILTLITATLRTNYYQAPSAGNEAVPIAFKLRSKDIEWLPAPKPYAEIFVSSPRFEGVHLRFGPVARGGLRWSDRPQDFRTEVLGLVKAQQVKNVVIVPQGSKGGFVPRNLPTTSRDAMMVEGIACYKEFITNLLSITDNLDATGAVVPPPSTVRRDGDDPYLVVAADKGTATFSDIANEIAVTRGFWLGDAFASGGSVGYDHKKMAITARGAWEAVKRHFREMNMDIQTTPFTVVGVGDMSGDVFGNGMLLSPAIKLVAAFDHRDIFIDPNPDPAISLQERQRLFELPRSSWQDYDRSKLSQGAGIYSRGEKYITLSPEAQTLLELRGRATPQEVMTAILKAQADLLWFGGIGTYVRASSETDAQAGDRANDAVRVTGADLRVKVVGEGANLGMTQKGRIEFGLRGGKGNTDAIDNSAGVNTSDIEVNIKIALGAAVASGKIDLAERNRILPTMTDDVAANVLRNNYLQTLAISLGTERGLSDFGFQQRMMQRFEKQGSLDRKLEALPTDAEFRTRRTANQPLTRPELAVLLAYGKIDLENELIHSRVPDDPYLGRALFAYFPASMRERFAPEIESHRLRREIIATTLTNDILNRGGSTFVVRLVEETGFKPSDIAYAFAKVMAVYGLEDLYHQIDSLDGKIDGHQQLSLYRRVQDLLREQTAWFLRHGKTEGLEPEIMQYREGVRHLADTMFTAASDTVRAAMSDDEASLTQVGVPAVLAKSLASLGPLTHALDIVNVASTSHASTELAAKAVFSIRNAFRLDALSQSSDALASGDYFDRLAVNSSLASISSAQRVLARNLLAADPDHADFEVWHRAHEEAVSRVDRSLRDTLEGSQLTLAKLTVAVSQLRDLAGV